MSDSFLPIAEPDLSGNERQYVNDCLDSGWISSAGPYVTRFAEEFARYVGVRYALAVSSGTAALHLSLLGLEIGKGDEVIVPDLTFVASANSIAACGGTPVFVDVDPDTWNIDPIKIEEKITPRTKAIMVVHLYGNPAAMQQIMNIAKRRNLFVVEDAAEAHGAEIICHSEAQPKNLVESVSAPDPSLSLRMTPVTKKVGSIGNVGCFSFYGNKIITTGEGGMVVTDDERVYRRMIVLRDHGQDPGQHYFHTVVGYNYRMTSLQAAIGVAQLERINTFIAKKREIASWYREGISTIPGLRMQEETAGGKHVYWMPTILIDAAYGMSRDELSVTLKESGIDSRPVFTPMNELPPYRQQESYPVSHRIAEQGLSLPSGVMLTKTDIERVIQVLVRP